MTEASRCPRCGATLPAPRADCPRCLFRLALREEQEEPREPRAAAGTEHIEPPALETVARALTGFTEFELLGQGGMGSVFKAVEVTLQRPVAIKVLPRGLGADPVFRERFLREARALARLSHPGIVGVHGYGEVGGLCYLVMELVEGVNLRQLMRERPLEPRQVLAIVRELCDALQYAHDEGVVHRDIKPENVLVDRAGRIKIADFGLAKLVGTEGEAGAHLTRTDQVMGTAHYMAPEQLERPREVDHRADLFALGVVLYEMLTGSLPRGAFELPSSRVQVDVRLDEIVLKALEREPSRRYQHALEVKTDVQRVEAGPASAATPLADAARAREPLGPTQSRAASLRGLRDFAACLVFWIVCAATWNLGPFVFGLSFALFCGLVALLVHGSLATQPDLARAVDDVSPTDKLVRRIAVPCATLLALAMLALGHLHHWERSTHAWVPVYGGDNGLLDRWRAFPWSLANLCDLAPAPGQTLAVNLHSSASSLWIGEPRNISPWWLMGVGVLCLVLALRSAVDPGRKTEHRRAAWNVTAVLAAQICGALVLLWVAAPVVSLSTQRPLSALELTFHTDAGLEEAALRLEQALPEAGLSRNVEQQGYVADSRSGEPIADVWLLRASAASPFERWHTSWHGPTRRSPQVWATLARPRMGGPTVVKLELGLYQLDSPEAEAARTLIKRLEGAFRWE